MPDARTVFTGDILFIGGTPIVWAGPLANWVAACDLMLGMDVDVVVPGHGPLTDKAGVAAVRDYLAFVDAEATARHDAGIDAFEAAQEIAALVGAGTTSARGARPGRIAVNVETVYRTLDPAHRSPDVVEQFRRMAALDHVGDCSRRSTSPSSATVRPGWRWLPRRAGSGVRVVVVGRGRPVDGDVRHVARRRRGRSPTTASRSISATAIVHGHRRHEMRAGVRRCSTTAPCATTSRAALDVGVAEVERDPPPRVGEPGASPTRGDVDARIVVDARGRAAGRRRRRPVGLRRRRRAPRPGSEIGRRR